LRSRSIRDEHVPEFVIHRPATLDDAPALFELRRTSILDLALAGMPADDAAAWAAKLDLAGMAQKLSDLEVWVAERDGHLVGWGAIRGDVLEGLYTAPEAAGRGVGAGLLAMLEGRMREQGVRIIRAEASSNARDFYLRRGYRITGPRTANGAWPIAKH
jgi:putative acetyltransferase